MEPFYKSYFQNLVAVSVWLKSFFYINDKYNPEAFDVAVKSGLVCPALLLDQYDYEVEDKGRRNYFQGIMGQFTILEKSTKGNVATIESCYSDSERIVNLIIARMRLDLGEGGTVTLPDAGPTSNSIFYQVKAKVQRVGPIAADYYGATCTFIWSSPFTVPTSSDDWIDL